MGLCNRSSLGERCHLVGIKISQCSGGCSLGNVCWPNKLTSLNITTVNSKRQYQNEGKFWVEKLLDRPITHKSIPSRTELDSTDGDTHLYLPVQRGRCSTVPLNPCSLFSDKNALLALNGGTAQLSKKAGVFPSTND